MVATRVDLPPVCKCKNSWLPKKLKFLGSTRFWAMMIAALATWFVIDGYITYGLGGFIISATTGFVGVRTIDRNIDKFSGDSY